MASIVTAAVLLACTVVLAVAMVRGVTSAARLALACYVLPIAIMGRTLTNIPLLGSPNVYLADLLLALALGLSVPAVWAALRIRIFRIYTLVVALLSGVMAVSVYRGWDADYVGAVKYSYLFILPWLSVAVAAHIVAVSGRFGRLPVRAASTIAVATVVAIIVSRSLPGITIVGQAVTTAITLCVVLAVGVASSIQERKKVTLLLGLVAALVFLSGSGQRGPALALAGAAMCTWMTAHLSRFAMQKIGVGLALVSLSVGLVAGSALVGVTPGQAIPGLGFLESRVTATFESPDSEARANTDNRLIQWEWAWETTTQEDPLFGLGAGRPIEISVTGDQVGDYDPMSGLHNSYLAHYFYAGIVGFVLLISVLTWVVWRTFSARNRHPWAPAALGALIGGLITAFTNVALEAPYAGSLVWALIGAGFAISVGQPPSETSNVSSRGVPLIHDRPTAEHVASSRL